MKILQYIAMCISGIIAIFASIIFMPLHLKLVGCFLGFMLLLAGLNMIEQYSCCAGLDTKPKKKVCPRCEGLKRYQPGSGGFGPCELCNGKGYIEEE